MPYENLTGTIPQPVIDSITLKFQQIITELQPYVINLSVTERKNKYKMGPNRQSLVANGIVVCDTQPNLANNLVDVPDLKDDFNAYGQMNPLHQYAITIAEMLKDTMMARGSEALVNAIKPLYGYIKLAKEQNVPGADEAYALLNPYYDLPDQPDGGE